VCDREGYRYKGIVEMKAYRFLTPWVCLLLAGISPLQGKAMAGSNKTDYEAVDEYITARMRSDHIPLSSAPSPRPSQRWL
jgi:hypothetical protein